MRRGFFDVELLVVGTCLAFVIHVDFFQAQALMVSILSKINDSDIDVVLAKSKCLNDVTAIDNTQVETQVEHRQTLVSNSSSCFPFVGVRLLSCHFTVRLILLYFPLVPVVGIFLFTFLPPLPFSDLSSHNPPNLSVVFLFAIRTEINSRISKRIESRCSLFVECMHKIQEII